MFRFGDESKLTQIMNIKRILLLSLFLLSIGYNFNLLAKAPPIDNVSLRKQEKTSYQLTKRQITKQQRKYRRSLRKARRAQRFLNSRLGKWMVKRAIRKAQRKPYKGIKKTQRIDDGNNGWIIGAVVFFAAGLLMAIVMAVLAITNPWIIIPATTLAAFLALYFVVLRPNARRKRRKINRKWM